MVPFHKFLLALLVVVGFGFVVQWNTLRIWTARGGWAPAEDLAVIATECRAGRRSTQKTDCTVTYRRVAGEIESYQIYLSREGDRPQAMWRSRGDPSLVAPDLAVRSLPDRLAVLYVQFGLDIALILFGLCWAALRYGWLAFRSGSTGVSAPPQAEVAVAAPIYRRSRGFGRRGLPAP